MDFLVGNPDPDEYARRKQQRAATGGSGGRSREPSGADREEGSSGRSRGASGHGGSDSPVPLPPVELEVEEDVGPWLVRLENPNDSGTVDEADGLPKQVCAFSVVALSACWM